MKRVLLVGLSVVALTMIIVVGTAMARGLDSHHCKAGFPVLISCTFEW
jgi:hypothetical protein